MTWSHGSDEGSRQRTTPPAKVKDRLGANDCSWLKKGHIRCTPDDQAGSRGRTVNQNNIIFESESFAWLTSLQWSSLSFVSPRFYFFSAFLGLSVKTEGRTNGWIAATKIIQQFLQDISGNTFTMKNLKMGWAGFSDHFNRLASWKTWPGRGQYWQDESPPSHPQSSLKGKISRLSSSSSLTAAHRVLPVLTC